MKIKYKSIVIILCLLTLGFYSDAKAMSFDPLHSSLNFISVKKNSIAELHSFDKFSVALHDDGTFNLQIDLSSVNTAIEVRNHRLRTFLFEVIRFPTARVIGQLSPSLYKNLKPGQYVRQTLSTTLSLHGIQKKITTTVEIIALADDSLRVSSLKPILLDAKIFGLSNGIKKIAELAKLDTINTVVPVTFSFSFRR